MNEAVEQLKCQVGTLTVPEYADLAYFLLNTLEPEEEGAEAAWRVGIARRVAEIRSGQAVGRPADEVLAELRSAIHEARHAPRLPRPSCVGAGRLRRAAGRSRRRVPPRL